MLQFTAKSLCLLKRAQSTDMSVWAYFNLAVLC